MKKMPHIHFIEPTNHCNIKCKICPRSDMTRECGFMSMKTFDKIIREIDGRKSSICFMLFGESLMHPQLEKLINACPSNIEVLLTSNGMLLDEKASKMLLKSRVDKFYVDLDGLTKETHEKNRGSDFDIVMKNFEVFLEMRKEIAPNKHVGVVMVVHKKNVAEVKAFRNYWGNKVSEIMVQPLITWGRRVNLVNSLELISIPKGKNKRKVPCNNLWTLGGFMWNGDFTPCCRDYNGTMSIGNINDMTLKEMWNSKKMEKLREEHLNFEFKGICKNCTENIVVEGGE